MPTNATLPVAANPRGSLVVRFAERYGVDSTKLMETLKQTCFRQKDGAVSDAQMMSLLVVANEYGLNPFTKEIYAFPDKAGGIVPVVGVDGWIRIINSNPQFAGMVFDESDDLVIGDEHKPCPAWMECTIHRKDRAVQTPIREYFAEVYRPPFKDTGKNGSYQVDGPWQSHTSRMMRHKVLIQAARVVFGYSGIVDPDEYERIAERDITPHRVVRGKPVTRPPRAIAAPVREPVATQEPEPKVEPVVYTKVPVDLIRAKLEGTGTTELQMCEHFEVAKLEDIALADVPEILDWLEKIETE